MSSSNWNVVKGKWKQLRGSVRHQWGKLTDDEVAQIDGDREKLLGKVQEHYACTREQAEDEVDRFCADQQ